MANIVIGTAGHVDHGKTTLIKALTGIETDTTHEEKKRGMSINLGFAYLDLPDNLRAGIVDVPGHEKFIKNMVAGLPGINLVLMVIDAGEGVMPQTREHLDILSLLGVRDFIIALTKADTVDEELLEMVEDDIRVQLRHTAAENAPIIRTDALSGRGLDELRTKIAAFAASVKPSADSGAPRLNIDRVFSVKGFGTVVTGTLLDGPLSASDELFCYPLGEKVRVRNIQIHEKNVTHAEPHQRTALNLASVSSGAVKRGDLLCSLPLLPTRMLDTKICCLKSAPAPLRLWDRVRLLIGTREVMARLVPLGSDAILPGKSGFAQLRLEKETLFVKERDRFIIRSYSPMRTIGGGEIVDAAPQKHRRFKKAVLDHLRAKDNGNDEQMLLAYLASCPDTFADVAFLQASTGFDAQKLKTALEKAKDEVIHIGSFYLAAKNYKKLRGKALQILNDYHRRYPLRGGIPVEEFRSRLRKVLNEKYIAPLLSRLIADKCCRKEGQRYAAASFKIAFSEKQQKARALILKKLSEESMNPLKKEDLNTLSLDAAAVLEALEGNEIISLDGQYVITRSAYQKAVDLAVSFIAKNGRMMLGEFRDISSSSRKNSMLLLEYMDSQNITQRVENYRILGKDFPPKERP